MLETRNPFKPRMGAMPPFLAGRERPTAVLARGLGTILARKSGRCVIMCGPRGNGKTVLLGKLARDARAAGARTCELVSAVPRAGSPVPWEWLVSAPQAGGTAAAVSGDLSGCRASPARMPLSPEVVPGVLWSDPGPALLLVDEAHVLPPRLVGALLHAVQRYLRQGFPLLALLVGTPGLLSNLGKANAGFWVRATRLKIGRLGSDDAVREALGRPAEESGFPIDDDALELLVRESEAYPLFIQQLGRAAWRETHARRGEPRRITLADAQAAVGIANRQRRVFYGERRKELEEQGVLRMAETVSRLMLAQPDQRLHWRTLKEEIVGDPELPPVDDAWDRARESLDTLEKLGLIWDVDDGNWEPGIPLLCRHIVSQEGR